MDIPAVARRLDLQIAAVLIAMLAVVSLLTLTLYENSEHAAADRQLRYAARTMVPGDTRPGFWVVIERGRTTVTDSFPRGLPYEADLGSVRADHLPRQREVTTGGHTYLVRTQERANAVAQVAMDRSGAERTRRRLIGSLAIAGAVGAAMAIGVAVWVARRVRAQPQENAARTESSVSP